MIPPQIGNGQIGSAVNFLGGPMGQATQPGMTMGQGIPNAFTQQMGRQPTGPMGAGIGQPGSVTPGQTPMNVQHPIAQLPQQKPQGGGAPGGSPTQGMQQALGGLQKMMKGGQASPSQAQTASATPGAHQPQMPLNGNPQFQGADSAAQQSGMNPAAGPVGAAPGDISNSLNTGLTSGGLGDMNMGGLLGNGFDPSFQGGALDPGAMTGMDLSGMGDMGGGMGDIGGLLGFL